MTERKEFTWTGPQQGHFAATPAVLDAPAGLAARPGRAQVTLECLIDRMPDVRLVEPQREQWIPNLLTPVFATLLLEW